MSKTVGVQFLKASILFLLVGCIWGALMTLPPIHEFVEEGPAGIIVGMHTHWNLLGWVTLALMGSIYYLVPVMTGKDLYSERLGRIHFWIFTVSIVIGTILGVAAGIIGGNLYAAEDFEAIEGAIAPFMILVTIVSFLEALVNFLFAYNIYKTVKGIGQAT